MSKNDESDSKDSQIDDLKILLQKLEQEEQKVRKSIKNNKQIEMKRDGDKTLEQQKKEKYDNIFLRAKYQIAKKDLKSFADLEEQNIENMAKKTQSLHNRNIRTTSNLQEYKQLNPLDKAISENKPVPHQYQELWEGKPDIETPLNVGQKMVNMLEASTERQTDLSRALRQGRGVYFWKSYRQGKMGIDAYFMIFGIIGVALIPIYLYNFLQPHKNFVRNQMGITKESLPDLFYQNKYDLDEISVQKTYLNLYSKEIQQEKERLIKMGEINKQLRHELDK